MCMYNVCQGCAVDDGDVDDGDGADNTVAFTVVALHSQLCGAPKSKTKCHLNFPLATNSQQT